VRLITSRSHVAALNQLAGDANGDFAGLITSQRYADWAAKLLGQFFRNAAFDEFANENFALGLTADHTQIWKFERWVFDFAFQNGLQRT